MLLKNSIISDFILSEHKDRINDLELLENGDIVSCSNDCSIKIWKKGSQTSYVSLNEKDDPAYKLKVIGKNIISSHNLGIIKYREENGKMFDLFKLCQKTPIKTFFVSDNEIISNGKNDELMILNLNTKHLIKLDGHDKPVTCIEVLETGEIITGSQDNTIKIWSRDNPEKTINLIGHKETITCLKSVNNNQIISSSKDGEIRIWSLKNGECVKTFDGHEKSIECLELSKNNEIITGSLDNTIKCWDLETGICKKTLLGHTGGVLCLKVLESNEIVSGSEDRTIRIWS